MSFNLSYFIEFTPAVPEEQKETGATSVDTQAILDAIAKLGTNVAVQPQSSTVATDEQAQARLEALSQNRSVPNVKKRVLRPAVSGKDNRVEKTDQPLRTVKRKLVTGAEENSLSKQVVDELAQKIANSRMK